MKMNLHKLATTTPKIRNYIWNEVNIKKRTGLSVAKELKLSTQTVSKWSKRDKDNLNDRSHAKHNLNLLLNPKEEEIIIYCRGNIGLSIRDICIVLKRLFDKENQVDKREIKYSRNSINMCIKRHNINTPLELIKAQEKIDKKINKEQGINQFDKVEEPGFIHIDFKYLPRIKELNPDYKENKEGIKAEKDNKKYLNPRTFMFSAIDRYSRYVYTEILEDKSINNVVQFLSNFIKDFENKTSNEETGELKSKVKIILTDNGGVRQSRKMMCLHNHFSLSFGKVG